MPVYRYQALSASGKKVKGQIDAESPRQAKEKLKAEKLLPTEIVESAARGSDAAAAAKAQTAMGRFQAALKESVGAGVGPRELGNFSRQLAVLLRAGIPLVESLTALIEQNEQPKFQSVLSQVRDTVNEGGALADALGKHPAVFNNLFVNMVRAGESSGTLEIVLIRLADFLDGQAKLRGKVMGALAYPFFIVLVMIGAVFFLVNFVLPNMLKVFDQTEMELPLATQILIVGTNFLQNFGWVLLVGLVAGVVGLQRYISTEKGRKNWDALKLRVPLLRRIVLYIAVARLSRTLGTLLKSGVNMISSLRIVQAVIGNETLKAILIQAETSVTEGATLERSLRASGVFPATVLHMIAAGEKSGELENMLLQIADIYEEYVESYTLVLTSLLQPLIIVTMALMIGFILTAVLLPMMQMNNVL